MLIIRVNMFMQSYRELPMAKYSRPNKACASREEADGLICALLLDWNAARPLTRGEPAKQPSFGLRNLYGSPVTIYV